MFCSGAVVKNPKNKIILLSSLTCFDVLVMPRHKYCLFPGCKGFGESVFRLPKKEPMRARWIEAINNPEIDYEDKDIPEYRFVVCSLHFHKEDYQVCRN